MLENYLKTTLRALLRQKANTAVNVTGLTLGITCSLIVFLILRDGGSYDKHHRKFDRIYRVVSQAKENGKDSYTQGIPPALPEAFRNDFTDVEQVAFTSYRRSSLIAVQQPDGTFKKFEEPTGLVITEPSFFRIFDREILIGDSQKGLDEPNEAIISRKWAIRYFETVENAIGKVIRYDDHEYGITAIMEDYPSTTDLPFELMLSYATVKNAFQEVGWGSVADQDNCYFLLKEGVNIDNISAQVPAFVRKYLGEGIDSGERSFIMQPLKEIHTDRRFGNYNKKMPPEASISFAVIGIFLLLLACINFINLTTAEAVRRTKEVGVRKVLGSTRGQLILKFIAETFVVTFLAVIMSLALTQVLLNPVNSYLEVSLALNLGSDHRIWMFLCLLTVGVSVVSGLYPAYVISKFKPALVVRGNESITNASGFNLRRGLVVMQFFISQLFIIGTIIILQQMNFMENQYLGFRQDAIITVPIPERGEQSALSKMRALKNEVLRLPGVEAATLSNSPPSSAGVLSTGFRMLETGQDISTQVKQIDGDYLTLFDIDLVAGEQLGDHDTVTGFIVNEKLVEVAGYDRNEAIVGKEIDMWGKRLAVKGVVGDFSTRSLSKPMEPVILLNDAGGFSNLSMRLAYGDMQASIRAIQKLWEAAYPEYIFKYEFLDEQISKLYRGERRMSILIAVFAGIAVAIGCLGVFGLISFMANRKVKEIGIRKVLGASVESILLLFSKEFVKLILIGFLLAAPLSAFVMGKFLQEFAYQIKLGPLTFLLALVFTLLIVLATVCVRSFRAATANPVHSLRSE